MRQVSTTGDRDRALDLRDAIDRTGYYPEVVEARFDRVYMALQQIYERCARAFTSPISDDTVSAAAVASAATR